MYGKSIFRVASLGSVRFYNQNGTKRLLEFLADMPKANTARIADAQKQRQQISKKGEKYELQGASTVYLQVLGSGARGVPSTLYLFTDQKRYLFNCGECTQRLAHEHKVKLSRLEHIFITSKTWKNIGGLPGLSLTLQDVGVPKITLHGPDGLAELYNATKRFVIMKDMEIAIAKCSTSEDFEDSTMTVKCVFLAPTTDLLPKEPKPAKRPRYNEAGKELYEFTHDETDYYQRDPKHAPKPVKKSTSTHKPQYLSPLAEGHKTKTEQVLLDLQMMNQGSVSYICTLKKRLGTLDLAKCVELGVKPGPILGQLKAGQDVILPNGRLVLSKAVKTPDDPGPVFIVLDVPVISYLKPEEFKAHFQHFDNPPENVPVLIVHLSPPHVYHDPIYQSFMALFGPTCRHLVLNSQNSCMGSEAVHRTQHKLHLLDPDIFPLLRDMSVPAEWNAKQPLPKTNSPVRLKGLEDLKNRIAIAQFQNIINMESSRGEGAPSPRAAGAPALETHSARTLTTFHLRPKKQLDRSAEPKLHVHEYYQEAMDVDGFVSSLDSFRRLVDDARYTRKNSSKEFPRIVFLGTGSCIPSKTRNTSGIVLHIDESSTMLLDCGEGTFGQMVRFYGPRKVNDVLRSLKAIYISHLHADHHIGLIGVLQARAEAKQQESSPAPVFLLAPGQIMSWLSVYDQHFEKILREFTLVPNQNLMAESNYEMSPANLAATGIQEVKTCLVPHCPNAFGVALTVGGHKVTYSGDTLPSESLVKIGMNSSILIHEATMEDELEKEARIKMHSTTSQAIDIGRQMHARYTVLTHFSQRYARLPRLNSQILHDNNTVGIAFDNMQITLNDLELLPHMYAPLQLMFADHCVEMELKAAHRERRRDRRTPSPVSVKPVETNACTRNTYSCLPPFTPNGPKLRSLHESGHNTRESKSARSAQNSTVIAASLYRESNSSRLRQQMRAPLLHSVTTGESRSKSSSPSKRQVNASPAESTSPDTTASNGSHEIAVDFTHSARDLMDQVMNASKDRREDHRVCTPPSSCNIDSRPSTSTISSNGTVPKTSSMCTASYDVNGYGKPLVTPVNRKLIVRRREMNYLSTRIADKKPAVEIDTVKSPTRQWRPDKPYLGKPSKVEYGAASQRTTVLPYFDARNMSTQMQKSAVKSAVVDNKLRISVTKTNVRMDMSPLGTICNSANAPRPSSSVKCIYKSPPRSRTGVVAGEAPRPLSSSRNSSSKSPPRSMTGVVTDEAPRPFSSSSRKSVYKSPHRSLTGVVTDEAPRPFSSSSRKSIYKSPHRSLTGVVAGEAPRPLSSSSKSSSKSPPRSLSGIFSDEDEDSITQLKAEKRSCYRQSPRTPPDSVTSKCNVTSRTNSAKNLPTNSCSRKSILKESVISKCNIPSRTNSVKNFPTNTRSRKSILKDRPVLPPIRQTRLTPTTVSLASCGENRSKVMQKEPASKPVKENSGVRPCGKDIKQIPQSSKPNVSFQGVKGFKPKLEDIKSSYLLLNNVEGEPGKKLPPVRKPEPFSESKRRSILLDSKMKFQSKSFKNDSKYDKIEGLNWISWN